MTHYEVLGVAPDAPPEEVRRAYLRQARRHHPDRHAAGGAVDPGASERRMRQVNEAWSVLGDPRRRAAYDRTLRGGPAGTEGPTVADRHVVQRPSRAFTPFHPDDEDDDDSWRYEPDDYDPRTGLGRVLGVAPVALLAAGLALGAVSLVVGLRALAAAALACLLLAALLFLLAPLVALGRSVTHEGRPAAGGAGGGVRGGRGGGGAGGGGGTRR